MLTIRLHRIGKNKQPSFKMVVVDKRESAAAGKSCEEVGSVNRIKKQIVLDKDRIAYWLSMGAQPSNTVRNLLISQKLLAGKKISVHAQPKKKEGEAAAAPVAKTATVAK